MMVVDELAIVDNLQGKLYLIVYADPTTPEAYPRARQRLRELRMKLRQPVDVPVTSPSVLTEVYREFAKDDYLAAVHKAKESVKRCSPLQKPWPAATRPHHSGCPQTVSCTMPNKSIIIWVSWSMIAAL